MDKILAKKILTRVLKTLFIRIPIAIIAVVAITMIFLRFYLTADRTQNFIVHGFNDASHGTISLQVKEFNPYRGFVFENILIKNGKEFNETKFVEIQKLTFRYSLFPIFIGKVRFPEIGIYKPRIYLTEKNGVWNAARLMKPGKAEKKKPKDEKKEKKEDQSQEISLPISVEFYLKFILDDLRLYMKGGNFSASVENLSFNAEIDIPPFKKIPKSLAAVSILKKMNIVLNPQEEMNVSFYSKDVDAVPPLVLTWKLVFDKTDPKNIRPDCLQVPSVLISPRQHQQ